MYKRQDLNTILFCYLAHLCKIFLGPQAIPYGKIDRLVVFPPVNHIGTVSYTHLDVYKRQATDGVRTTEEIYQFVKKLPSEKLVAYFDAVSYTHLLPGVLQMLRNILKKLPHRVLAQYRCRPYRVPQLQKQIMRLPI